MMFSAKSVLHAESAKYLAPPAYLQSASSQKNRKNFIPKKWIHTF